MRYKKAQLHSPLTMGSSILGIIVIIILFSLTLSSIPEPKDLIAEMEVTTYGDIFLMNFLNYETKYLNQDFMMSELIIIYYDAIMHDNSNPTLKKTIENTITTILSQATGMNNPCFTVRLNDEKEFEDSGSCEDNKLKSEMYLPYDDEVLLIRIEGK